MRIAVCDDEKVFRTLICEQLDEYARRYSYNFIYFEFSDGETLLSSNINFDLIFIDHQMNKTNGLDTVRELRRRNDKTTVIFVSSYKDIVFDSLEVKTFRFLVKPLNKCKLFEAMDTFISELNQNEYILARDESLDKICRVSESQIVYCEADNIYAKIRTKDNCFKYKNTLSFLEENLKSDFFYRTHRSYIVNFNYISGYADSVVYFDNGEQAALTKSKYFKFQKAYMNFLKRKSIGLKR